MSTAKEADTCGQIELASWGYSARFATSRIRFQWHHKMGATVMTDELQCQHAPCSMHHAVIRRDKLPGNVFQT